MKIQQCYFIVFVWLVVFLLLLYLKKEKKKKKVKEWFAYLHRDLGTHFSHLWIAGLCIMLRQQDILNVFLQGNSKDKLIFLLSQCFHIPKSRLCRKNSFSIFLPLECTEVNVFQNTWYLNLKILFTIRETLQSFKVGFLSHHLPTLY